MINEFERRGGSKEITKKKEDSTESDDDDDDDDAGAGASQPRTGRTSCAAGIDVRINADHGVIKTETTNDAPDDCNPAGRIAFPVG